MRKALEFATLLTAFAGLSPLAGQEEGHDHERLTTSDGRTYHEIFVIGSDAHGLTFRHREGIAKVGFGTLSQAYRMLYEGVETLPEPNPQTPSALPAASAGGEEAWGGVLDGSPVALAARSRLVLDSPASWRQLVEGGGLILRTPVWPAWWPDHERVHRLAHPFFRELAVREFLHTAGLLPFPCGR